MKYTIEKNRHFSLPRTPKFLVRKVEGTFSFTNSVYNLVGDDQYDWNKLTGISFNPLQPDQNAIMIGWRWNKTTEKFEVGPYYNIDGSNVAPDHIFTSFSENQKIKFKITYDTVIIGSIQYKVPDNLNTRYWSSFRIQPFFGGNKPAPETLILELDVN
jgi:hypothetical protein